MRRKKGAHHMYSAITLSVESERLRLRRSESSDMSRRNKNTKQRLGSESLGLSVIE